MHEKNVTLSIFITVKIPYFRGDDEESFIRQLSARVIHSTFIPGICIVKEGDQGSSMFVVLNGEYFFLN